MNIKEILQENVNAVVRCVSQGGKGYPAEYEYYPDKRVMGEIAQYMVNATDETALFDDLINHFGHERIGREIMLWHKAPMNVPDRNNAAANLHQFISKMLVEYAEYQADKYSRDIVIYYKELQRGTAESRQYPEEV